MNETSKKTIQPMVEWITIEEDSAGQRLDNFLIKFCKGLPKSHIYRMVRTGEVRINRARAKVSDRLSLGDVVRIPPLRLSESIETKAFDRLPSANNLSFPIVYDADGLIAINKPAGMAVHGGSGISMGVIERIRQLRPQEKMLELVHRLDRDTSGLLLIASKRRVLVTLHEALREGRVDKRYLALVVGDVVKKQQSVKLPLMTYRLDNGERRTMVNRESGKPAWTIIKRLNRWEMGGQIYSLVEASPRTGRTHQIRAHLAALKLPIVGDDKYGHFETNRLWAKLGAKRMFLHASVLTFLHPVANEKCCLEAPLPKELEHFVHILNEKGQVLAEGK